MNYGKANLFNWKVFVSHNKSAFLLILTALFSVLMGVFCCQASGVHITAFDTFTYSFWQYFLRLFLLAFIFLLSNGFSSVFLLGPASVTLTTVVYCFGIGYASYSTVALYGFKGFLLNAVCVALPASLLFAVTIIFSAKSIRLSFLMCGKLIGHTSGVFYGKELKRYLLLFLLMLLIALVISLITTLLTFTIADLLNLFE